LTGTLGCTLLTVLSGCGCKGIKPNPAGRNTVVDALSVSKYASWIK